MAKSTAKSKKLLQKRTRLEKALLGLILLLILLLLLAASFQWWPFGSKYGDDNLGTAFYTASPPVDENAASDSSGNSASSGNGGSSAGSAGSNGSDGSAGSNGSNGSNGGTTPTPAPTSSAILNFSAGVNTGTTKEQISGQAGGLNENCALLIDSCALGKQEVCTYTEGNKIVTVTFLNDRVVSASRTGF